MHGQGSYFYADGSQYEGNWKNGQKHGQGVYIFANGARYEGELKENNMHGHGSFVYPSSSGVRFDGEMAYDRFVQGILFLPLLSSSSPVLAAFTAGENAITSDGFRTLLYKVSLRIVVGGEEDVVMVYKFSGHDGQLIEEEEGVSSKL